MTARRIVYLSDGAWYGGAERYLVRLSGNLDRKRFSPVLLFPKRPELEPLREAARIAGVETCDHDPGNFAGARGPLELLRSIRRLEPDILHMNLPSVYDLASCLAAGPGRLAGSKAVVCTEHIVDLDVSRRRAAARKVGLLWIDRIIAISEANRKITVERHGTPENRVEVIYNGVEDPGPRKPRFPQPFEIVCVASLEARKGQELLIRALARVRERGIDARLCLVGEGPLRAELEQQAVKYGIADRVRFTGRIENPWREIQAAHVLAVPSVREGVPFAVLEGMAGGAVVMASDLPGIDEIIETGRTGLVVRDREPESWAECLSRLATDARYLEDLAGAGRSAFEERFGVSRMVRETETLYERVLT